MDTAKVDIRKLQLLNDRIAQTIDALNQVRMSVHGLQHTGQYQGMPFGQQMVPQQGFGQQMIPQQGFGQQMLPQQGFGQVPQQGFGPTIPQQGYGQIPWGMSGMGLGHTSGIQALQQNPALLQLLQQNPQLAQSWGLGQVPMTQQGLGHTSPESFDVYGNGYGRIAQTFPFVQWGLVPYGPGYSQVGGVF